MLSKILPLGIILAIAVRSLAISLEAVQPRANCADVVVHYARGTFEAKPIGGVIGQTFQSDLEQALTSARKTLAFVGVDYSADLWGFLAGGDKKGSVLLADSVSATAANCPKTKIVMAGYSQGAQLVHIAAGMLSTSVQQRVAAVVTFGDPKSSSLLPSLLESRRKTFCRSWDLICAGTVIITTAHTTYAEDGPDAAAFVLAHI